MLKFYLKFLCDGKDAVMLFCTWTGLVYTLVPCLNIWNFLDGEKKTCNETKWHGIAIR